MLVIHPGETSGRKARVEFYSRKAEGRKGWEVGGTFTSQKVFILMVSRGRNQEKKEPP